MASFKWKCQVQVQVEVVVYIKKKCSFRHFNNLDRLHYLHYKFINRRIAHGLLFNF